MMMQAADIKGEKRELRGLAETSQSGRKLGSNSCYYAGIRHLIEQVFLKIKSVQGVANKTNLLAINASIETSMLGAP
jgi:methyl-accepting chemotaxis protein